MKKIADIRKIACLALCGCMFLSGCLGPVQEEKTTGEAFEAYTDELFKEEIVKNTVNLHYTLAYPENYGITDYETSLGVFSLENMEESYQELEQMRQELLEFEPSELTEEQRLTYDILMDYAETELSVEDLMLYTEVLSPTLGYQSQLPVILAEYTFRTEQDIEDYLSLAAQMDEMFADVIAFEEQKAKAGLFMPDYAANAVIDQCSEFIMDIEQNYMIEVFDEKIEAFEGLSEEEKTAYKEQNYTIITTEVAEGFQTLIEGLSSLKGSATNEQGLCYYEDGSRYYEYLVRQATGSDSTVKELEERTEAFIEACLYNIRDAVAEHPDILDQVMDYRFPITEPDAIMQDLIGKVSEDFPEPPEVNYTIKKVHPSMQEHMSPAFYLTTPVDDIGNHVIYINEKYLGTDATMDLYPTMAHEGYPGHLYQNSYTNSCNLPLVRNLLSYPGYSEGWATYVEFYSYGISGLEEQLAKVLEWNQAATLGLYAYLDMGIHYDGWSRKDAAEYLAGYGISDEGVADAIYETMVEEPANYLSYFIGYLEFLNLRDIAEEELGEAFVAKEFHQFLMETGPAPFYVLEAHMENWIKEQKAL